MCFAAKMTLEIGATDRDVRRRNNASLAVIEASLAACVKAVQRSGDIDPDADPDELAWLLFTIFRGIDVMGAAGRSASSLTSIAESAFDCLPVKNKPRNHQRYRKQNGLPPRRA